MSAPEFVENEIEASPHLAGGARETDIPALGEEQVSVSFRESKISFAVDTSGSTYGPVLEAEQRAIKTVSSLIPHGMNPDTSIIPWRDVSQSPLPTNDLNTLRSGGGTNPNVLLEDSECRLKLQESELWFLMTDGVIEESSVRAFARNLADYGMHGKACIISVFGERVLKPADCRISVGLAVFAVSPHVAFLYTDVEYDKTYVLCTKGCFSSLLHGREKSMRLDYDTEWNELPQISYEDLTRVSVPKTRVLGKDELALQGDLQIDISKLLTDTNIDRDLMRQIMFNEDNRRTLANTARVRGEADKLTKWLDRVENTFAQDWDQSNVIGSQMIQDYEHALSANEEVTSSRSTKESAIHSRRLRKSIRATRASLTFEDHNNAPACFSAEVKDEDEDEKLECRIGKGTRSNDNTYLANTGFLRPTHSSQRYSSTCSFMW